MSSLRETAVKYKERKKKKGHKITRILPQINVQDEKIEDSKVPYADFPQRQPEKKRPT